MKLFSAKPQKPLQNWMSLPRVILTTCLYTPDLPQSHSNFSSTRHDQFSHNRTHSQLLSTSQLLVHRTIKYLKTASDTQRSPYVINHNEARLNMLKKTSVQILCWSHHINNFRASYHLPRHQHRTLSLNWASTCWKLTFPRYIWKIQYFLKQPVVL